ncbi:MAG: class I SAM-dependent methyltransferase [Sphingomonadales bacterium]|nr:MAG: class I SAM-dependent methyltransferase [Sphingomonadales bacterium]
MSDDRTTEHAAAATYDRIADAYADKIDTKPHNAYYDRPAVISLWHDLTNREVLDAGCGPGVYAEELVKRGARVTAGDISPRMREIAKQRLGNAVRVVELDLSERLPFEDAAFDVVNAPLCLDYIRDWDFAFAEFNRVLKRGGCVVISAMHPSFDAEYYRTERYFEIEAVSGPWSGFGEIFVMNSYRRPMADYINAPLRAGLVLDKLLEPLPTPEFRDADPRRHAELMRRPAFLMMRLRKL